MILRRFPGYGGNSFAAADFLVFTGETPSFALNLPARTIRATPRRFPSKPVWPALKFTN
jgi:hypothetical protein